ncbi:MAG TPA: DUF459 domain-containing protein [Myxococcales bacterium]|nr:DUF459 domain-containing protein [Myxococcales bacterium]
MNLRSPIWILVLVLLWLGSTVAVAANFNKKCAANKGRSLVYGIGASTMGSVLGPMLKVRLKRRKTSFRMWGKASSGLARPDFHDWPSKITGIARRFGPELFIVSLGTNDGQHLWNKKKWVKFGTAKWKTIYKERINNTLKKLVGKKKRRAVIWIGPYNMEGRNASTRGKVVQRLLKETVRSFDGPVAYHDLYKLTSNRDGSAITSYKNSKGQKKRARARDGIHLSTQAALTMIALPVIRLIDKCLPKPPQAAKKRTKKKK